MTHSFSITDLCALIKQAGDSGVSELSLKPFRIKFHGQHQAETIPSYEIPHAQPVGVVHQPESESRELAREEIRIREDQLSMALLEDPAEYERLIAAGELEDDA